MSFFDGFIELKQLTGRQQLVTVLKLLDTDLFGFKELYLLFDLCR